MKILLTNLVIVLILTFNGNIICQEKSDNLLSKLKTENKIVSTSIEKVGKNNLIKTNSFLKNIVATQNIFSDSLKVNKVENNSEINTRQIQNAPKLYKENSKSVVLLVAPDGSSLGAGCIISSDGDIVTNYHVINGSDKMIVYLYSENTTKLADINPDNYIVANVIAALPEKDLAYLKVSSKKNFKALKWGKNSKIEIAQDVFAIGHPESYIWSFTTGVISQLRNKYEWSYDSKFKLTANVIQTQTPINPGNSGGPLFNEIGELIGINSFRTGDSEGLNFAVRMDEIEKFLKEVKSGKHKYIAPNKNENKSEIKWDQFDSDEDGKIDSEFADLNQDGTYDIGRYDSNGDGYINYYSMDTNGDDYIDILIYDKDQDGSFEYFQMDTDFDRRPDTIGIDRDGDFVPDDFYDYK